MYLAAGGKLTHNVIVNNGGAAFTDIIVADGGAGIAVNPNISFNVFDDISAGTSFPGSGTRGVGTYNVKSNGDPILVP